jgi:hypothetical protein
MNNSYITLYKSYIIHAFSSTLYLLIKVRYLIILDFNNCWYMMSSILPKLTLNWKNQCP